MSDVDMPALAEIWREIGRCDACHVRNEAGQPTPFSHARRAKVEQVWVGRNPGITERDQGLPFVGRTKASMDAMIAALGLTRDDIHLTNVLKCYTCDPRPDRPPTREECDFCAQRFLYRELELLQPKIVVTWGKDAVIAASRGQIPTCRGRSGIPYSLEDIPYVVFPMEHPGVLIRNTIIDGKPIAQKMEEDFANLYLTLKEMGILQHKVSEV